ncbi:unnamed protein product [Klebsiella pneumoniae subsp. rhinoscleromatis SB3432]|nr:unnamed protein product [Klebsiella pneumoniae subsp. rhinoscleromatis SB3432]
MSVKEKIGYGMGDAASHIIFDNVMLYMMFFYTDIFGIPAGFVGTMFLLSAVIAKRYYTLKTPFLKKMMAELAEGARRNEQEFTAAPIDKEWQN